MSKKILVTGANGQVGQALASAESQHEILALDRNQLDITDTRKIDSVFSVENPDVVINAAAYTQVDRAEHEPELAFAINRDGVGNLARKCAEAKIPLLHISTDYVFDGAKINPYQEIDPIAPLGVYGESKAEGEAMLRDTLSEHIILRTIWVFSATGSNFVKTMLRLGKERDELSIVDDQYGCPTSARSIAEVLLKMSEQIMDVQPINWGTYHFCNRPDTSWYLFAREIFNRLDQEATPKLNPIPTSEYPTPARRPVNSVLKTDCLETVFGFSPVDWNLELDFVLKQLKQ